MPYYSVSRTPGGGYWISSGEEAFLGDIVGAMMWAPIGTGFWAARRLAGLVRSNQFETELRAANALLEAMQRQDWATMLELALKHVQRYKESTDGYVGLALALIKLHRFDEVAQATDALEQLGEPAEAQHLRAWAAVDGGDATRGLAECDRLLEHPEYRYQAFAMRSKVQLSRGNLDKALGDANHSLATDPTSTAYALRGDIRWAQGNLEGALADYTRASAKEPDAIEPLEKRASILHALGRANEAAADISTAESLRKEHGPLWR